MNAVDATESDVPAITAIYNDVIETSTAVFSDRPVTVADRVKWLRERHGEGFPVLVVRDGETTVGFGSYGRFRTWPGYHTTVEHSVHVAESHRRQGIGRTLLEALVERARAAGFHAMVGGIDAENTGSLALHEQLGFVRVGHLPEIAHKFGRYVDLELVQITLERPAM